MQLIAWRTVGKNPCDDPPVHISIAPLTRGTHVCPWVLLLKDAREMFGEIVDQIGEKPVEVTLNLSLATGTPPASIS